MLITRSIKARAERETAFREALLADKFDTGKTILEMLSSSREGK